MRDEKFIQFSRTVRAKRILDKMGYSHMFHALNDLTFYKIRVQEFEANKDKFPEPYYTMICNILANGKIEV